jgi:hypothetical protein
MTHLRCTMPAHACLKCHLAGQAAPAPESLSKAVL